MIGITSFGAYIPRLRLQRSAIAQANTWFDPSLKALSKGERSMCNWDEDVVTMAVEAGQDASDSESRKNIAAIFLASTTAPFLDRQNAAIVAEALNLSSNIRSLDVAGSQRAATGALISAIDAVNGSCDAALVIGSEHRRTRVGTTMEMLSGDAAAAITIGTENVLANLIATHSFSSDFVDHYRTAESEFDYDWEERWIRDEGYLKMVPDAVDVLLKKSGLNSTDFHFILPTAQQRVPGAVAKKLGVAADKIIDNLLENCGQTGVAHPLLLLAHTLEKAKPGEHILVIGFGQGCDALLFQATDAIASARPRKGVSGWLEQRVVEENYAKFQTFNGIVEREFGKRAEADMPVRPSSLYRNRKMVNGFLGGRCSSCGTVQFPKAVYCVNPECGAHDSQEDHAMADATGRVLTWTADRLTFDLNPPAYFGMVEFDEGGRAMMDFTDVDPETFDVDTKVDVHFRVKQFDHIRGFRGYFWKAAPIN